jgi:predicted DNA-binding transcriptional regulator AlpA
MSVAWTHHEAAARLEQLAASKADAHNVFVPYSLLARYGVTYSRIHLMRLVARGQFPAPFHLSERRLAWRLSEVRAWLKSRPARVPTHYDHTS